MASIVGRAAGEEVFDPASPPIEVLEEIQRKLLWLSTMIVDHANQGRPNPSGLKVGGHQASSASMAGIVTSVFFDFMRPGDRVSVKPHASPVLQAAHYLLGNLDVSYLPRLRQFHGLQAYPSRTKDPYPVDFSTGSVGLGAVAPNFAALVDRYVRTRFGRRDEAAAPRFIALVGDAELDEGSIWEAVAEPALASLDNVIWVVDLNRQSLDRVVPGIRVRQLEDMFRANGWAVIEAKYGRRLEAAFARPGGEELRSLIDQMPNEEYQFLLRSAPEVIRDRIGPELVAHLDDTALRRLISDLGGHDLASLRQALRAADAEPRPAVIFAYTVKGWGLPIAGDPMNHSALLSPGQVADLAAQLGMDPRDPWTPFPAGSAAAEICAERGRALRVRPSRPPAGLPVPADLGWDYGERTSTQRAFGQVLTHLRRTSLAVAERVVTVSPDVATSTNLGGWINRVGLWEPAEHADVFRQLGPRLIEWDKSPRGQHIELGISETNLLMMLGQLGLAAELAGEPLLPIGTLYDPFIARGLDALIYGLYSGARFILVGTPSGITLAPEGGAHQSVITPVVGLGLPRLVYWEPCFAQELEWILLAGLAGLHRGEDAESCYLRLSTLGIDQQPLRELIERSGRERVREQVLSGAYRLLDHRGAGRGPEAEVEIWATGVMVAEAVSAARELLADGIAASVVNCVSPDLLYRRWQQSVHRSLADLSPVQLPAESATPIVTVIDGHPATLAWLGGASGRRVVPLGVDRFGESGRPDELYQAAQIDAESIQAACFVALGGHDPTR